MTNGVRQRFIDLLEEEATQAHKMAQAWKALHEEHGAYQLEDLQGETIATAMEMVTKFTEKEKELRAFIAKIKSP